MADMAAAFSLTYLLVLLQLVSCSHFRGGIVQWRPLNTDPMSFNGQVTSPKAMLDCIVSLIMPSSLG